MIKRLALAGVHWCPVAIAVMAVALMLVPADSWKRPAVDAVYPGFDKNLVYVSATGGEWEEGLIAVERDELRYVALPGSAPTAHLVNTPLSFDASADIRVLRADQGTTALRVGLWNPGTRAAYLLEFGSSPREISVLSLRDGAFRPRPTGPNVERESLGTYTLHDTYRTTFSLDRTTNTLLVAINGSEAPPSGGRYVMLGGTNAGSELDRLVGPPVSVQGGVEYDYGGFVKVLAPGQAYGFTVEWLDSQQRRVGLSPNWSPTDTAADWTRVAFRTRAPASATGARLFIAGDTRSPILLSNPFLSSRDSSQTNLIPNASFQQGADGWLRGDLGEPEPLEILIPFNVSLQRTVSADELPELFDSKILALTAYSTSETGVAEVRISNYELRLPHSRWFVEKVDDGRARILASLLAVLAVLAIVAGFVNTRAQWGRIAAAARWRPQGWLRSLSGKSVPVHRLIVFVAAVALATVYVLFNLFLANVGGANYDLVVGRITAYTILERGLGELYHVPNTAVAAEAWVGTPVQPPAFPYGPVMAYPFAIAGWAYKLLLMNPVASHRDISQIDLAIRVINILAGLLFAVIAYDILRMRGVRPRAGAVAIGLFLFNPALWFVGTVWGQTQIVTLVPFAIAIWMAERRRPTGAWIALAVVVLTRQQLIIPAALLGFYFVRRFPLADTIRGVTWAVLSSFLLLLPFMQAIGPSVGVDPIVHSLAVQGEGDNEQRALTVSKGALSLWPLLTLLMENRHGMERLTFPSTESVVGGLSYFQAGNVLLGLVLLACMARLLLTRRTELDRVYIAVVALGAMALFMFKTLFSAFHFLPVLGLLVLCRGNMSQRTYWAMVAGLTLTILLPMYSIAVNWMSHNDAWAGVAFSSDYALVRAIGRLIHQDWFLSTGSYVNVLITVALAWSALVPRRGHGPAVAQHPGVGELAGVSPARKPKAADLGSGRMRQTVRLRTRAGRLFSAGTGLMGLAVLAAVVMVGTGSQLPASSAEGVDDSTIEPELTDVDRTPPSSDTPTPDPTTPPAGSEPTPLPPPSPTPTVAPTIAPTSTPTSAELATPTPTPTRLPTPPTPTKIPTPSPTPTRVPTPTPIPTPTKVPTPTPTPTPEPPTVSVASVPSVTSAGAVDRPRADATVAQRFALWGWTLDPSQTSGCGLWSVEVWSAPIDNGGSFLGFATTGQTRAGLPAPFDGPAFAQCGFYFLTPVLVPGTYTWYIYPVTLLGATAEPLVATFRVSSAPPVLQLAVNNTPSTLAGDAVLAGWAVDLRSDTGTGVKQVEVWSGPYGEGQQLAVAKLGIERRDLLPMFGEDRFRWGGWSAEVRLPVGWVDLHFYARSAVTDELSRPVVYRVYVSP